MGWLYGKQKSWQSISECINLEGVEVVKGETWPRTRNPARANNIIKATNKNFKVTHAQPPRYPQLPLSGSWESPPPLVLVWTAPVFLDRRNRGFLPAWKLAPLENSGDAVWLWIFNFMCFAFCKWSNFFNLLKFLHFFIYCWTYNSFENMWIKLFILSNHRLKIKISLSSIILCTK